MSGPSTESAARQPASANRHTPNRREHGSTIVMARVSVRARGAASVDARHRAAGYYGPLFFARPHRAMLVFGAHDPLNCPMTEPVVHRVAARLGGAITTLDA